MGMILRLAGNIGAEKVLFVLEQNQQLKENKLKKTAQTAIQHIDWTFCLPEALVHHLPEGYKGLLILQVRNEEQGTVYQQKLIRQK